MRSHARRGWATALVAGLAAALVSWAPTPAHAAQFEEQEQLIDSGSGSDAVQIDSTLFVPSTATESEPAAAILLAHGYGGTKDQTRGQAVKFARDGYVVLTFTARGFGESTGQVSINAPEYEVADASTLIDFLAEQPEVRLDDEGDPRVGVMGGSYGGALSLLVAGYDDRVDAVQATRTWNSLISSLFPNSAGQTEADTVAAVGNTDVAGVFKETWAQFFFAGGSLESEGGGGGGSAQEPSGGCEDMRPEYCDAYDDVLQERQLTDDMRTLLEASSPASILDRITAPTLLAQGEGDKLFSLAESDANARGIAATGTPVSLVWVSGGHGGTRTTQPEALMLDELGTQWFDYYLRDQGSEPEASFTYTKVTAQAANGAIQGEAETLPAYPGLASGAATRLQVPLTGEEQEVEYPDNGEPAAYSALPPGFFPDGGDRRQDPEEIDGQYAVFESDALVDPLSVVGAPTINIDVASTSGEAVLFAKIYDVDPSGEQTLIQDLVAPVRLSGLPESLADAEPSTISLPAIAQTFDDGHQIRVVLASTDQAFGTPTDGATYQIALSAGADPVMSVPDLTGQPAPEFTAPSGNAGGGDGAGGGGGGGGNRLLIIGIAVVVIVIVAGLAFGRLRRRSGPA